VLRILHQQPYSSPWWSFMGVNFFFALPSLTQAVTCLTRLAEILKKIAV